MVAALCEKFVPSPVIYMPGLSEQVELLFLGWLGSLLKLHLRVNSSLQRKCSLLLFKISMLYLYFLLHWFLLLFISLKKIYLLFFILLSFNFYFLLKYSWLTVVPGVINYVHILFIFFSLTGNHHKILNIFPCVIE